MPMTPIRSLSLSIGTATVVRTPPSSTPATVGGLTVLRRPLLSYIPLRLTGEVQSQMLLGTVYGLMAWIVALALGHAILVHVFRRPQPGPVASVATAIALLFLCLIAGAVV